MKAFVLKHHEKVLPTVRAIRDEELKSVAGGLKCSDGKLTTNTVNSDGTSGDDGCDKE